jgi:hypothetical protein
MKKMTILILIINLFTLTLKAPEDKSMVIVSGEVIMPYEGLIYAIGKVECNFDTLAYNPIEEATGFFQIRPIRLNDYNNKTGSNYKLIDMYNYQIAEKVFLHYASIIGPYNFERIIRNWNGKWELTDDYYCKVKSNL